MHPSSIGEDTGSRVYPTSAMRCSNSGVPELRPLKPANAGSIPRGCANLFAVRHAGPAGRLLGRPVHVAQSDERHPATVKDAGSSPAVNANIARAAGSSPGVANGADTACREAWPFLPALEAGDRWFESTHADQLKPLRSVEGRRALNAATEVRFLEGLPMKKLPWARWERCGPQNRHEPVRFRQGSPALVAQLDEQPVSTRQDVRSNRAESAISLPWSIGWASVS
jgi:hypothetical protein